MRTGYANKLQFNPSTFSFFQTNEGLRQLDCAFLEYLSIHNAQLHQSLLDYRQSVLWGPTALSEFIIQAAYYLNEFCADFFNITNEVNALKAEILNQEPIFQFKKYYVQMHAKRHREKVLPDFQELHEWLLNALQQQGLFLEDLELSVARLGLLFLSDEVQHQENTQRLIYWCVQAQQSEQGRAIISSWQSFRLPQKKDPDHLVPLQSTQDEFNRLESTAHRQRDGFTLTDPRMNQRQVLSEIHYCVYCHETDGDFCSKGFPVKKNKPELGYKVNPLNDLLTGCPLEEKISEMHWVKKQGYSIGALAIVMIDNPMCAVTGHRICNDCMKACIYQKQDPVNIPEIETRVLTDVLHLPWGVEVYDLLMRWNPLRQTQYLPKEYNGKKVMIMGMGPAGFTMAHHLMMEGCAVVGADGLKIEPLETRLLTTPIQRFDSITTPLDERTLMGFGGVAEYGITVRWDKNFLQLIYLSLSRRHLFQVFGGVRFGGTLTVESAWSLGFDHIVLAVGAGLPRELNVPNSLASGMRQANDFLMALQLTGAYKKSSLANLQVRMPAVVIGGGLTGIDTATEVQAYYIVQVEKIHSRYTILTESYGVESVRKQFDAASLVILDEFLQHAQAVLQERAVAANENRAPDFIALIRQWGGVTIVYRRDIQSSPAYQRNHEEIIKALEEGIYYSEHLEPLAIAVDAFEQVSALRVHDNSAQIEKSIPAKSIFVATGAKPNIAYAFEHRDTFLKKNMNYERFLFEDKTLKPDNEPHHIKSEKIGVFTSVQHNNQTVSFIGDTHPIFHGSVVKAIASAKRSYPAVIKALACTKQSAITLENFQSNIDALFKTILVAKEKLTEDWIKITVHAPLAAAQFKPGQFYRIQNFEMLADTVQQTKLQTEAIAALGILDETHPEQLQFLIKQKGVSTQLIDTWKLGPISLMGPTGVRTKIMESQTVLVVGDDMAIPYLLSVGPAMQKAGCKIYFIYNHHSALICTQALKNVVHEIFILNTLNDAGFVEQFSTLLPRVDTLMVAGSVTILKILQTWRNTSLKPYLKENIQCIAAVYGPMQCMLKGVCAQCLQWQIDAKGQRTKAVYTCSWQHQPLDIIDTQNLTDRLSQNKTQETLTLLWWNHLMLHSRGESNLTQQERSQ